MMERSENVEGIHWHQWRKVLSHQEFPFLVAYNENIFDPLTSLILSHIENPVTVTFSLPIPLGKVARDIIRDVFPTIKPVIPHKSPPDWKGNDLQGEFFTFEPYPVIVTFFLSGTLNITVSIYCSEDNGQDVYERYLAALSESLKGKACMVKAHAVDCQWSDSLSSLSFQDVIKSLPSSTLGDVRIMENMVMKCLDRKTRKGATFLITGAPGTGKTLLAKALLDKTLQERRATGFYMTTETNALDVLNSITKCIREMPDVFSSGVFVIVDDAETLMLSRKKFSVATAALKMMPLLDNLPTGIVLCFITNMVSEVDTATIRPARIDLTIPIPASGWGDKVFTFWAEKVELPTPIQEIIMGDEKLRNTLGKLTPAEAYALADILSHKASLGVTINKQSISETIKQLTKWRRFFKERDWEEAEGDVL